MTKPALTPERLDQILVPPRRDRIVWTLPAIGARIGVGVDFARKLARQPGSPIKEVAGRYYAFEDDLFAYLRATKG